jgi:hypothetical protein
VEAIRKFGMTLGFEDTLDAVTAMASLTKKGKNWHDFVTVVTKIRAVLDQETNPRWRIGNQLLPGFILRAMEADPKFDVELTLLRKTQPAPDIDQILSTLGAKAREQSKGQHSLTGFATTVQQPAPRPPPPGGQELCRNFARDGKCRYDQPDSGHWCKHSHGAAEDVKRMAAQKAHRASGRAQSAPPRKPKPGKGGQQQGPDGCYRCGSKNHGIDACTEEVKANVAVPSAAPFNVSEVATAIALAMQQQQATTNQAVGMVADPLGIGPSNAFGTGSLDHELQAGLRHLTWCR